MKVILLQDVAKIGKRFDTVDVPHGYALNMLIPKGFAQEASQQNIKNIEARKLKAKVDKTEVEKSFSNAVDALKKKVISIKVDSNDKGHLFEALKSEKICEELAEHGINLTPNQVHISNPIKETGEHEIELKEGESITGIKINVVAK